MTEDIDLISPDIPDLQNTRKAAEILGVSFKTLRIVLRINAEFDDLKIAYGKLTDLTESELAESKAADDLYFMIEKYNQGKLDATQAVLMRSAIEIDPVLAEFVRQRLITNYFDSDLPSEVVEAFEKRMEMEPEFKSIVKIQLEGLERMYYATRTTHSHLN